MIVGRRHTDRWGGLIGTDAHTMSGPVLHAGRAPCVVAFHGFTGTTSEIRPPVERLADRGFAVHAPLLPGHGSNPSKLQDATFDLWISEMEKEVRAAQTRHERFILFGFSLGSLVALDIAARKPAGLLGVVLLGNAVTLSAQLSAPLAFFDRRGWALPDWYILKLWSADVRDREQRKRIASYDRDPLRAALEVYRGGRRVEPLLPKITCPTLVIHGGLDRVCPASNASLVAESLGTREVKTLVYPRSGHLVAVDHDRDEVAEEVARFVEEIAGRR